MPWAKDSAFGQEAEMQARFAAEAAQLPVHMPHEEPPKGPPFEHWHHDLVTVDTLLDQTPPEVERARALLLEVTDEIHSQFESIGGKRNEGSH